MCGPWRNIDDEIVETVCDSFLNRGLKKLVVLRVKYVI